MFMFLYSNALHRAWIRVQGKNERMDGWMKGGLKICSEIHYSQDYVLNTIFHHPLFYIMSASLSSTLMAVLFNCKTKGILEFCSQTSVHHSHIQ